MSNDGFVVYFQRQDTDERLRRLQTDKEALALQVKTLTEQVQTLTSKISELERTVKEKNQLLANAEDLLQRVSVFANTVGIQIDKQKVPRNILPSFTSILHVLNDSFFLNSKHSLYFLSLSSEFFASPFCLSFSF